MLKDRYIELKEYIDDYVQYLEKINEDRLEVFQAEMAYAQKEMAAFNMLRKNIQDLYARNREEPPLTEEEAAIPQEFR